MRRESYLLMALGLAAAGAAANIPTLRAPLPDVSAPAGLEPLVSVRPTLLSAWAPEAEPERRRTRAIDYSAVAGAVPGATLTDAQVLAAGGSAGRYPAEALLPYLGSPHGLLREYECGDIGSLWYPAAGGAEQSFAGYMSIGAWAVGSAVLGIADEQSATLYEITSGGGLCVRPAVGCSANRSFSCDCSVAPDHVYDYTCAAAPATQSHWCDNNANAIVDPGETINCPLTSTQVPADGTWQPAAGAELRWISTGLPGPVLVDGTLDLAGADLTLQGAAPVGAVLLRAEAITGSAGDITAPSGLTIVVDTLAGEIRVGAAP
jgi:hypothetical protein